MSKIILDLCGGSGAWSKPYKDSGYDVRLITLPEFDVRDFTPPAKVYGILAAPPCTMFSLARTKAKTPRFFNEGMDIVLACLKIIWCCRIDENLKFWALENPVGYLRQFLGKPAFTFQPWYFGDKSKKRTDLWGYFNSPISAPGLNLWDCFPENYNSETWSRIVAKKDRAITPAGFAKAFFEANK